MKYYSLEKILSKHAIYNIIIGERSNGKTYAVSERGLKKYCEKGFQMALIRRWGDDLKGRNARTTFSAIVDNGLVAKYSGGRYNDITYMSGAWYLSKYDENLNKNVMAPEPFCYSFSLNSVEHTKSTSYPRVKTILFDEFLSRKGYLEDEFILFMNTLSTIIRERDDVEIFMLANTVNKYSPYFTEMGLTNIQKMKQGDIDIYRYGGSDLVVAVEYCDTSKRNKKKSDIYFAFDNPQLNMITKGDWEIPMYPHLPRKYKSTDVIYRYYIVFHDNVVDCEIVMLEDCWFTYCHKKTTPIKEKYDTMVYTVEHSEMPNHKRHINSPSNKLERSIWYFFQTDKVFYQDNEIGEIVNNYLIWCGGRG